MQIAIEHLAEGLHPIHLENMPAADFIPVEDCRFASPIKVDGTLTVSENSLVLQADVAVSMTFSCGRCLEEVEEQIDGEIATYYEKTDRAIPEGEELTESDDVEVLDYGAEDDRPQPAHRRTRQPEYPHETPVQRSMQGPLSRLRHEPQRGCLRLWYADGGLTLAHPENVVEGGLKHGPAQATPISGTES